jgi:hypothetical protein
MKKNNGQARPRARKNDLIVRDLADEVLVYDRTRHRAYCLNRTAALVWRLCDGATTPARMARSLENKLGVPVEESIIWLALSRLGKSRLLEEPVMDTPAPRVSRREIMKKAGLAAMVALPLVTSIVAPTAAQAQTTCIIGIFQCSKSKIGCCCVFQSFRRKCVAIGNSAACIGPKC